jgi:hypothetical protein
MNRIDSPRDLVPRPFPCRVWRAAIATATLSFLIAIPASDASAQGPLRRLGDRLRGRILIQPIPSNPYGQPQARATTPSTPTPPSAPTAKVGDAADPSRSANFRRATPPPPQPGARGGAASDAWSDRNVAKGTTPSDDSEPPTDSGNKSRLGVTIDTPAEVVTATGVARRPRGAIVTAVAPRSPADVAGVKAGDRIVAVDGRLVNSVQDLVGELARFEPGQKLKLQYSRGDRLDTADVALATRDQIAQASAAATEPAKTAATPNTTQTPSGNKSILGGLGSALGGLLAGKGNGATTDKSKAAEQPTDAKSTVVEKAVDATQPNPTPAPPKPGNTPPVSSVPAPDATPLGVDPLPLEVDPTPLEQLKPEPLPATAPERLP